MQPELVADTEASEGLPCRGCMADCPNRKSCQGKPWRLPAGDDAYGSVEAG